MKLLGNDSLIDAVKFYLANRTRQVKARTLEEVPTELLDNKRQNGRSKLYLTDLKLRLTRFAKSFRCPIHTVEPAEIQRFLNGLKMKGRSRNNFRRAITVSGQMPKGDWVVSDRLRSATGNPIPRAASPDGSALVGLLFSPRVGDSRGGLKARKSV